MSAVFSLTLYVSDVARSVEFYRVLLDREPVKAFPEYGEFVAPDTSMVFGLLKVKRLPGTAVNRIAVPMTSADLDTLRSRLALAGVPYRDRCDAVEVLDPDENQLTAFAGTTPPPKDMFSFVSTAEPCSGLFWEHRVGQSIPEEIPHEDGTLDEVLLQVTINGDYSETEVARLVSEVFRVLKPGGRVTVTGYVGHVAVSPPIKLPGVAGRIRRLPQEVEPAALLKTAGFRHLFYELFGDIICFRVPGVDMRKIRLSAVKPGVAVDSREVIYQGPFTEITLDNGTVCRRGERLSLPSSLWDALRSGPAARQFTFLRLGEAG